MTSPDLSIPNLENKTQTEQTEQTEQVGQKRMKMIQLAEIGEISQGVKYIKKASDKVICKLYTEYLYREQDKTNAVLADTIIVKFSDLLEMLNTVPSAKDLAVELKEDKLLQGNVKTAYTFIAPFIPFIGLITGGATVGKHVMKNKNKNEAKQTDKAEQSRPQGGASKQASGTSGSEQAEYTDEEL